MGMHLRFVGVIRVAEACICVDFVMLEGFDFSVFVVMMNT